MNDRQKIKKVLKKLELTSFKEITPMLLGFGFDRLKAQNFIKFLEEQNFANINHNGDIKWISLKGIPVLLENLEIKAKLTLNGEKYLHENLTFLEKIKSEWWRLLLVNVPGILIGSLLTIIISSLLNKENKVNESKRSEIKKDKTELVKLTEFKNGRWISTSDSLAGIEIKNEKWVMFYKGMETDSTDIYDFKIRREYFKELGTEHKPIEYLTLTNESDTLDYSILKYNKELLSLSYIPRGNTLNYKPEK
jgi:hypothetical protein